MAITAADVKKLRDITGAGMMDCKKALSEANGDMAQAEKILKEMGLAAVAKRQDRATENGRVFTKVGQGKAVLLELTCETDFVASNDQFKALGGNFENLLVYLGTTRTRITGDQIKEAIRLKQEEIDKRTEMAKNTAKTAQKAAPKAGQNAAPPAEQPQG